MVDGAQGGLHQIARDQPRQQQRSPPRAAPASARRGRAAAAAFPPSSRGYQARLLGRRLQLGELGERRDRQGQVGGRLAGAVARARQPLDRGPAAEGTITVAQRRLCSTMRCPSAAEPSQPMMRQRRQLGAARAGRRRRAGPAAPPAPSRRSGRRPPRAGPPRSASSSQRSSSQPRPLDGPVRLQHRQPVTGPPEVAPQGLEPPLRGGGAGGPGDAQDAAALGQQQLGPARPGCGRSGSDRG